MKKIFLITLSICIFSIIQAQNVGIGTDSPKDFTKLDIQSTTSGFQLPRMTTAQRTTLRTNISNLSTTLSNQYSGMMVYDIDNNTIYMWDGSKTGNGNWVDVLDADASLNDADADATNELNTGISLSGTTLSITDAGGSKTQDLTSLKDHNFYKSGTTEPATTINDNIFTKGLVGINNTTPAAPLSIGDGTNSNAYLHITRNVDPYIALFEGNSSTPTARIQGGQNNGHPQFLITSSNGATDHFVVNQDNGNVGIGTNNPTQKLEVNGYIKSPNWPAFFVYNTSGNDQSTTGKFNATVEKFDNGNNFNLSTDEFTAPVTGFYQFNWTCYTNYSSGRVFLFVNNTAVIQTNTNNKSIAITLSLNAGDRVWISGNGYSMTWYGANAHNAFSGHLIMAK